MEHLREILGHLQRAQALAQVEGFANILQPGLVREMVLADLLGHVVHKNKHGADAFDPRDPKRGFEYLCLQEGGTTSSFQLSRMFRDLPEREVSLRRISRNAGFFFAFFKGEEPLNVRAVYDVPVPAVLAEVERMLDKSKTSIVHVHLSALWVRAHGKLVFSAESL